MLQHAECLRVTAGSLAERHRVHVSGQGARTFVFAHGFGNDQSAWSQIAPHFEHDARCVLFDLPGAGPLLPPDFDHRLYRSVAGYADDLLALLDELGVQSCTYIGHSVSGMVGILAAIEAPARFERLVLLNASARYLDDEGYCGGFDGASLDQLFEAMTRNYHGWVAGFTPQAIPAGRAGAVDDFAASLLAMRPEISVQIARMIFRSDIRALLPELRVPTTLIQSRNDIAVPAQACRWMAAHIPGAEIDWLDTEGHLPHLSAPAEVVEALRERLH